MNEWLTAIQRSAVGPKVSNPEQEGEKRMVSGNSTVLKIEGTHEGARTGVGIASKAIIAALTAIALGSAILFVVGFSHGEFIHGAAHDVRHAAGFPCH